MSKGSRNRTSDYKKYRDAPYWECLEKRAKKPDVMVKSALKNLGHKTLMDLGVIEKDVTDLYIGETEDDVRY